jgi:cyanophycinase-like exopeptidase
VKRFLLFSCFAFAVALADAQSYTSYFTGNPGNSNALPAGGVCIMGGASEHDEAMKRFLEAANGGDVLVLRASGSDGYNAYLYSQLGVTVNSVETIVCHNASASTEAYLHTRIQQAEAIWFAGGDQWNYVSYWRGTAIDSLVRAAIARGAVVGGTSAGMAILGQYYFTAQNGTVQSAAALANPYDSDVTVDSARFVQAPFLDRVITDTHYDSPDRRGRHVAFMARIATDYGAMARGIACDEYTAVWIDSTGIAHVYGDFPSNDDNAYFIQMNCELAVQGPEVCQPNSPLHWVRDSTALEVYQIKGTQAGTKTFDLRDWRTGTGGTWQVWYVQNGVLLDAPGQIPGICDTTTHALEYASHPGALVLWPNPATGSAIQVGGVPAECEALDLLDAVGRVVASAVPQSATLQVDGLAQGLYWVRARGEAGYKWGRLMLMR